MLISAVLAYNLRLEMMLRLLSRGGLFVVALVILAAWVRPVLAAGHSKVALEGPDAHISALIRQLGDEQYSVRQQAQEELARLGAEAFDALVTAELNDDVEIAARAAYLVHLIRID